MYINNNIMRKNKSIHLNIFLSTNNTNNSNIFNLKNVTENKIISRNKKNLIKQNSSKKVKSVIIIILKKIKLLKNQILSLIKIY